MSQGYEGRRAGEQQCEGTEARVGREGGGGGRTPLVYVASRPGGLCVRDYGCFIILSLMIVTTTLFYPHVVFPAVC